MPKNIDDIVVIDRKRSIRNIPIPESRRKMESDMVPPPAREHHSPVPPPPPTIERDYPNIPSGGYSSTTRRSRWKRWLLVAFVLVVVLFVILSIFTGATLSYVPKSAALTFESR